MCRCGGMADANDSKSLSSVKDITAKALVLLYLSEVMFFKFSPVVLSFIRRSIGGLIICRCGGMADAPDSKSGSRKGVEVRVLSPVPYYYVVVLWDKP